MGKNSYFQFKQFTIRQENAAMKVGTDGVLLGALTRIENVHSILDIGTGTGLIALMLAQRCYAHIVAIDNEPSAYKDALQNVKCSPWEMRIEVIENSFQEYMVRESLLFDCIVCNPPYFTNSFKPSSQKRLVARHNDQLPFSVLVEGVSRILHPEGHFSVILPLSEEREFRIHAANCRLFPSKIIRVRAKPSVEVSRVVIEFGLEAKLDVEDELTVETEKHHEYQPEFIELVRDFYLNL
jgi:tRNA1Val (adenine37-N6)-methyltransferase